MTTEPRSKLSGEPMSEVIAGMPNSLNDLPVGMWEIVDYGRKCFGLEGEALTDFVRRCIYALVDAGAKPVVGGDKPNQWKLQVQYGSNRWEIAPAVVAEWLQQGAPTPEPWTGVWFGLPWSWLPERRGSQ
jgi:hypothetical protein